MRRVLGSLFLGVTFANFAMAEDAVPAPKKAVAHKKRALKKHARKKLTSKVTVEPSRTIAKEPEVQVYSEKTDFESLVREQQELGRRPAGFSGNARVVGLRRELGLTRSEADTAPQDIVLNAGFKQGISEGMVLDVARKIPILDPYKDNQQSELTIKFASIRVTHVEDELAVARLEKVESIRSGVGVGVRGVLVGDYVGSTK